MLASVDSTTDGLAGSEVERRLARDGRNELPTPKPVPAWRRLLSQFNDILIYILIAAAALKAYSGDWVDFAVIAVVILATGLLLRYAGLDEPIQFHPDERNIATWMVRQNATGSLRPKTYAGGFFVLGLELTLFSWMRKRRERRAAAAAAQA